MGASDHTKLKLCESVTHILGVDNIIMSETKTSWLRSHMESKREKSPPAFSHKAPAAGHSNAETKLARSWGKPKAPDLYSKYACRDGVFEKSPERERTCDHGDSAVRSRFGDYRWGRTVGGDRDLQPSPTGYAGNDPLRTRYLQSPRTHMVIGPKGPRNPWKDTLRKHAAPPPAPSPNGATPMAGELEIMVGFPRWLPQGVTAVFLAAETDDGAYDASDRMHVQRGVAWSGTEGQLGGALVLTCRATSSVTLHIMGETGSAGKARSLGSTTVGMPGGGRHKRWRLKLHAPLDLPVELAWRTASDVSKWWTVDTNDEPGPKAQAQVYATKHASEAGGPQAYRPKHGGWAGRPDWTPPVVAAPEWHMHAPPPPRRHDHSLHNRAPPHNYPPPRPRFQRPLTDADYLPYPFYDDDDHEEDEEGGWPPLSVERRMPKAAWAGPKEDEYEYDELLATPRAFAGDDDGGGGGWRPYDAGRVPSPLYERGPHARRHRPVASPRAAVGPDRPLYVY